MIPIMSITRTRRTAAAVLAAGLLALGGCTIGEVDGAGDPVAPAASEGPAADAPDPTPGTGAPEKSTPAPAPGGAAAAPRAGTLAGRLIYLDPGHAGTPPPAEEMVTDGRGGVKQCNTTGTAADDGWPEHTFNWELAGRLRALLEDAGAEVRLTRADDVGRAPCIDERARTENDSGADAVISIHADGNGEGARGFHVSHIADPLPGNLPAESAALAGEIRDAMLEAGFTASNYLGAGGIHPRADLTGLNLSTRPKVLVEFGNMRDSADIALLRSAEGQDRLATAVAAGIAAFLG